MSDALFALCLSDSYKKIFGRSIEQDVGYDNYEKTVARLGQEVVAQATDLALNPDASKAMQQQYQQFQQVCIPHCYQQFLAFLHFSFGIDLLSHIYTHMYRWLLCMKRDYHFSFKRSKFYHSSFSIIFLILLFDYFLDCNVI